MLRDPEVPSVPRVPQVPRVFVDLLAPPDQLVHPEPKEKLDPLDFEARRARRDLRDQPAQLESKAPVERGDLKDQRDPLDRPDHPDHLVIWAHKDQKAPSAPLVRLVSEESLDLPGRMAPLDLKAPKDQSVKRDLLVQPVSQAPQVFRGPSVLKAHLDPLAIVVIVASLDPVVHEVLEAFQVDPDQWDLLENEDPLESLDSKEKSAHLESVAVVVQRVPQAQSVRRVTMDRAEFVAMPVLSAQTEPRVSLELLVIAVPMANRERPVRWATLDARVNVDLLETMENRAQWVPWAPLVLLVLKVLGEKEVPLVILVLRELLDPRVKLRSSTHPMASKTRLDADGDRLQIAVK